MMILESKMRHIMFDSKFPLPPSFHDAQSGYPKEENYPNSRGKIPSAGPSRSNTPKSSITPKSSPNSLSRKPSRIIFERFQSIADSEQQTTESTGKRGSTLLALGKVSLFTFPVKGKDPVGGKPQHERVLSFEFEGKKVPYSLNPTKQAKLPQDAEGQLKGWLEKVKKKEEDPSEEAKRQHLLGKRVPYKLDDIGPALKVFEDKYGCRWELMKNDPKPDLQVLQIINDLRAANHEKHIQKMRDQHPEVEDVKDYGSKNLTSDLDFSIQTPEWNQAAAARAVRTYRESFEEEWGASCATVFDTNPYTYPHPMRMVNPAAEARRMQLHNSASLLTLCRWMSPEEWEHYKEDTLAKMPIEKREEKLAYFRTIEEEKEELEFLLNKTLVKDSLSNSWEAEMLIKYSASSEQDWNRFKSENLASISSQERMKMQRKFEEIETLYAELKKQQQELPENSPTSPPPRESQLKAILGQGVSQVSQEERAALRDLANNIKKLIAYDYPDSEGDASDQLHEGFKYGFENIEKARKILLDEIESLSSEENKEKFVNKYNSQIEKTIYSLKEYVEKEKAAGNHQKANDIERRIVLVQGGKISEEDFDVKDYQSFLDAFKNYHEWNGKVKILSDDIRQLDRLQGLLNKEERLIESQHEDMEILSVGEIVKSTNELYRVQAEIHQLAEDLQIELEGELTPYIQITGRKILLSNELERTKTQEFEAAKKQYGIEAWDMMSSLPAEGDFMLLDMQAAHLTGMHYARGAHPSEGEILTVVFKIQAGDSLALSLNHYRQAITGLLGLYCKYQTEEPMTSLLGTVKYAERLLRATRMQIEKANFLGIEPPDYGNRVEKLEKFYKMIASFKGRGISNELLHIEILNAAKEAGFSQSDGVDLERVKQEFIEIATINEAFSFPEDLINI